MSSNVGLSTPRGSGTSGYVQRNLSVLKPRAAGIGAPYQSASTSSSGPPRIKKPDQDILNHDRLREIEVKVLELQDRLEEEGKLDEDEIEAQCEKLRERLTRDLKRDGERKQYGGGFDRRNGGREDNKNLKSYQVHELAEAKIKESERLRRALGLRDNEVRNGDAGGNAAAEAEHPMARQERRKREREEGRMKMGVEMEIERREKERLRDIEREKVRGRSSSSEDVSSDDEEDDKRRDRR